MESEEQWKTIDWFESIYQISNFGRVRSLGNNKTRKTKILKTWYDNKDYECVTLRHNGNKKNFKIHRLVAENFVPNSNLDKNVVNHIDENKLNNIYTNLEWCTLSYNSSYSNFHKMKFIKWKNLELIIDFKVIRNLWFRIKSKIGNYPKG